MPVPSHFFTRKMLLLLLIASIALDCSSAVFLSNRQGLARQSSTFQCPGDGLYCTDCTNTAYCIGATALSFACAEGEVCAGDPGFAGCRSYVGEDAGECDCDSVGNTGLLADAYDSTKYIICVPPDAQYFIECADPQVFNSEINACEDPTSTTVETPSEATSSDDISVTSSPATTSVAVTEDPASLPRLQCQCGQVTRTDSNKNHLYNHPWTVALLNSDDDSHFCSGTIINTRWIMTAASCVEGQTTSTFEVRANEYELGTKLPKAITRSIGRIVTNGDIALVEMRTALSLTAYDAVKPACLPGPNADFVGDAATHTGYDHSKLLRNEGSLSSGSSTDQLNFVPKNLPFCREDVGGPVVSLVGDKEYLAGIGVDTTCNTSAQPVAKISEYYDWIYSTSNNGRFCQQ